MRTSPLYLLVCGVLLLGCGAPDPLPPVNNGGAGGDDEPEGGSGGGGSGGKGGSGGSAGKGGSGGSGGSTPAPTPDAAPTTPTPDAGTTPVADASPPTADTSAPVSGMGSFKGCPGCVQIFDGKTLDGWEANSEKYDVIMDDRLMKPVMRSTGAARGFLATLKSYQNFRLIYSNRLLGGGHAQNMLIWCQKPFPNNACGGLQYQPPGRSMWDYLPGQNKSPAGKTTVEGSSGATSMDWSQCEMLVKGTTGEFRVACCKLTPGQGPCKGVEILRFKDTVTGRTRNGPIAWQAHNKGHVIHWTDVHIEENPTIDDLITTK